MKKIIFALFIVCLCIYSIKWENMFLFGNETYEINK